MESNDYTVDQVPALFRELRERIRTQAPPEAVSGSTVLPGLESLAPAPVVWNPVQALSSLLQQSPEADGQEDPHFHSISELAFPALAGLIAHNAAARVRRLAFRHSRPVKARQMERRPA